MTRYRDPNAPAGRVVFGSESFVDGLTDDIEIGPETARLFEGAGIVEEPTEKPAPDEGATEKPAPKRSK